MNPRLWIVVAAVALIVIGFLLAIMPLVWLGVGMVIAVAALSVVP